MAKGLLEISRRRKRRWALIKLASWFFVLLLFLGAIVSIFYIPALRITSLSFAGLEAIKKDLLEAKISGILQSRYFHILPKNNLLILPRKELEDFLKKNLRIRNFEISRDFPGSLDITIEERKTWAIWCEKDPSKCFLVDSSGFVFAPAPSISGSAILKISDDNRKDLLGSKIISDENLQKIKYFVDFLPQKFGEEVSEVQIKDEGIFNLVLKNGWYLILDSAVKDEKKIFDNLVLVLNSIKEKRADLEYVDLRFAEKVFYKYTK